MKRLACIVLIVTILVSGLVFVRSAHAINVKGTLAGNTHWTLTDSPVVFNGSVMVGANASLTIDPGVTVNLGLYALFVSGTLNATGAVNNQIVFSATTYLGNITSLSTPIIFVSSSIPWSSASSSGCIIQNAVLNGIDLQIDGASPKIDNCLFNFATPYPSPISISGGSPIISNSTLNYSGQSLSTNTNCISIFLGNPTIINNLFEGSFSNSTNGITVSSGTPVISYNNFEGNGHLSAIVSSTSSYFTISNNVFTNCLVGVKAQAGSIIIQDNSFLKGTDGIDITTRAVVTISKNLIDSNSQFGIDGGGYIDSNTITNNQIGIHNPPTGTINNNNIVGNTKNSITATTDSVDAQNNWWGITDTQTINQTIYDSKVDSHLGTVTFLPFLTQPSQTAPSIPISTPIVTPVPTAILTPEQPEEPVFATPTSTPNQYSQSFIYQVGNIVNLNLITTATSIILILVWLIVILGYAAKKGISKYRVHN